MKRRMHLDCNVFERDHVDGAPRLRSAPSVIDAATVISCVHRMDVILRIGAVASSFGDEQPELQFRVTGGSMQNLIALRSAILRNCGRAGLDVVGSSDGTWSYPAGPQK